MNGVLHQTKAGLHPFEDSDALHCLSYCGFYPAMYDSIEKGKRIVVISIEVVGDWKQDVLEATKALVDMEHFDKNDFTFIELPPAESVPPEVFHQTPRRSTE